MIILIMIIAQVDQIFEEFDADNDGTVDATEMKMLIDADPDFASLLFSGSHAMKNLTTIEQAEIIRANFKVSNCSCCCCCCCLLLMMLHQVLFFGI